MPQLHQFLIASCTICMFSWDASLTHSNNIDRSLVNLLTSVLFSLPHCRSWAFDFVKTNGTYWPDALLEKRPPSNPNRMVLATLMACLAKRLAKDGQVLCNRLRRGYLDCLVRANRHLPTYNHHHNAFDSSLREPFVLFHFGDTSSPITWFWVCIDLTLWSNMSHVVKCKRETAPPSVFFCWTRQSSLRLSGLAVIFFTIYIATNLPCIIQHEGRFGETEPAFLEYHWDEQRSWVHEANSTKCPGMAPSIKKRQKITRGALTLLESRLTRDKNGPELLEDMHKHTSGKIWFLWITLFFTHKEKLLALTHFGIVWL